MSVAYWCNTDWQGKTEALGETPAPILLSSQGLPWD
jgi:hypothetical protein